MANIVLSWPANSSSEYVTGYEVWGADGTSIAFGSCTLLATVSALTWTEVGLPNDQDRTYYIRAVNSYGTSASPSGPLNITTASPSGGSGDVVGPSSATDSDFAQFDTTTGKLIKDGGYSAASFDAAGAAAEALVSAEAYADGGDASTLATAEAYTDAKVAGISWKQAVRAATTANGTLATAFANGQTIDGVTLATGDRILIKNQSSDAENGIYIVAASGAPARASDADSGAELVNATVYVSEGTTLADTQWTCTTNAPITPGSTALAFAQLSSGGLPAQADKTLLANISGGSASPTASGLSAIIDNILGSTRGSILYRGASAWVPLTPGTSGQFLETLGAGADPVWGAPAFGLPVAATLRGSGIQTSSASSYTVNWPSGTAAGDLAIIMVGGGFGVNSLPSGFVFIDTQVGGNWNGSAMAKILTSGDISTGHCTVGMSGTFDTTVAIATFVGATGGLSGLTSIRSGTGSTTAITAPFPPGNAQYILYFGSTRANTTAVSANGSVLQSATTSTNATGALYAGSQPALGNSNTFTFGTAGSGYYAVSIGIVGP